MYISSLVAKNFKGFSRFECQFPRPFSLLIGENASGKTSVLDALSVGLGALFLEMNGGKQRPILPSEIRRARVESGQTTNMEPQIPASVTCAGTLAGEALRWTRCKKRLEARTSRKQALALCEVAARLQDAVQRGEPVTLPVIAYFGTGRLWLQKRDRDAADSRLISRLRGYIDCLDPASSPKLLFQWWAEREWEEYQRKEELLTLRAVKQAIQLCLSGEGDTAQIQEVRYDARDNEVVARFGDGRTLLFSQLSDGYRNVLGMVADLSYRAAVLNPHLAADAAQKTPGVVLIDEIDLHLHPRWQRRVVGDLRRAFPALQFIATTHSPFIVQSVAPDEVINLDGRATLDQAERSIEDIAEHDMGVASPQRSARYRQMLEAARAYYTVLQDAKATAAPEERTRLKARLDELSLPFSDNPAYHAFLEMERITAGLGEDRGASR